MTTQTAEEYAPSKENFAELLDEFVGDKSNFEGRLIKGTVLSIDNDAALIDVGLKVEGRVPLKEFSVSGQPVELKVGDEVEVFIERIENRRGEAVLSRERARREEAWEKLEKAYQDGERVSGVIFGRVKGGFTVDLDGAVAFLPGSQVDIRPVRDIAPLINTEQPFQILKMDRRRGNIVVSRRAVLEDTRAEQRNELIANLHEGQVLEGIVKNITDYGAFVDLGGVDGLLHVTDIAWRRVNHPTDALHIGQSVKVQVIRFNSETQRISLGMKQLEADPWEGVGAKYPIGAKYTGRVTNITDYGAFVELEPGVEGLVHVSEMSWTKKNVHPGKIVSTSQEVEVMVLDVDPDKRRISLGLKQCLANPWTSFEEDNPEGTVLEGEIKNITEFGLFVELVGEIFGMVHLSDINWALPGETAIQNYNKGDKVKVKVLTIDIEKERIGLGIKQLDDDPFQVAQSKRGQAVTCTVTALHDQGVDVKVLDGLAGFVRRSDLARDRNEQRPDRFAVGDKFDAKLMQIDRGGRRITLSIKALEVEEEKQAVEEYGSTDSGASLGDILGAAISRKQEEAASASQSPAAEDAAGSDAPEAETADEAEAPEAEAADEAEAPEAEAADEAEAPEAEAADEAEAPEAEAADEAEAPEAEAADEAEAPEAEAADEAEAPEAEAADEAEAPEAEAADEAEAPEAEAADEAEAPEAEAADEAEAPEAEAADEAEAPEAEAADEAEAPEAEAADEAEAPEAEAADEAEAPEAEAADGGKKDSKDS